MDHMDDMPFGLAQQTTYAKLSPQDLDLMGKQASLCYLENGVSLNEAIVKIAREHPSISPHQIRRVVEAANTHTFSHIFEKQAGDKNVEFPIADPSIVLKELDDGARPIRTVTAEDYAMSPVKQSHVTLDQDMTLATAFGYDLASPRSEKTAMAVMTKQANGRLFVDRIMAVNAPEDVASRILKTAEGIDPMEMVPAQANAPVNTSQHPEITHRENMRAMERRIELEKKKQELIAMQAKEIQAMGDMGGAPQAGAPTTNQGAAPEAAVAGGEPPVPAGGAEPTAPPPMMAPPPPPPGPPPGLPGGEPFPMETMKKAGSALTKVAMSYVKSNRPNSAEMRRDLESGFTLNKIKEASARKSKSYPDADPYRDMVATKEKLARMVDDATRAKSHNGQLLKEATVRFQEAVRDHLLGGGNMGEVAQALGQVRGSGAFTKAAMKSLMPELMRFGFNPAKLQAQTIAYEMEKGASTRFVDPKHPIVASYADLYKVASNQSVLRRACSDLESKYKEANKLLGEVIRRHESSQSQ